MKRLPKGQLTEQELRELVKRAAASDKEAQAQLRVYSDRAQSDEGITVRDTRAITH